MNTREKNQKIYNLSKFVKRSTSRPRPGSKRPTVASEDLRGDHPDPHARRAFVVPS